MKLALVRPSLLLTMLLATYLGCAQSEYLGDPTSNDAAGTGGDMGQPIGPADAGSGTGGAVSATGAGGTQVTGAAGTGSVGAGGTGGSNGLGGGFGTTGLGGGFGAGGTTGLGGGFGAGGTTGLGGRFGAGGSGGSNGLGGRFGGGGSTGLAGSGGSVAGGGRGGTSSTRGGGAGGTSSGNGGAGAAATFTTIYSTILTAHCSGGSCHTPGSAGGVSFSSKSNAYSAVSSRVTPGNGANSGFYNTVNSGAMPRGAPKLSAADLASIKGWIDAGALNN